MPKFVEVYKMARNCLTKSRFGDMIRAKEGEKNKSLIVCTTLIIASRPQESMESEADIMSTLTVFLPEISDVSDFVNIMGHFPFEAQLTVGSYAVDAKSIMGIFTLDREHPISLVADTADENMLAQLSRAIDRFLYKPVSYSA